MPLAALFIAADTPGLRVLGTDFIEFQLRRARAAGAGHAVIYAERVTSALLATVDRLRGEGLSVDLARTVSDAAELIHPDEAVLILASNAIVSPERLASIATGSEPTLLCVRDETANDHFELIDPTARWTGFARIDGALLRRTAAMIGDWDLSSTLMRRAVQEGAARMTLTPDATGAELILIDTPLAAQVAGRKLVAGAPAESAGWGMHWVLAPLARRIARVAGDFGVEGQWITLAGFGLYGFAGVCALAGWAVASLIVLLLGLACDAAGSIGAQAGAGTQRWEKFRFPVRAFAATVVALAAGITFTLRSSQWGCIVLALVVVGATWLAAPIARDDARMARWRSDPAGHTIIGIVGFVVGSPFIALAVCAAQASISLIWAVRKALARS